MSPSTALVDVPLRIVLTGAKPGERVAFHASALGLTQQRFRSSVEVRADAHGVARAPMSLLSSMRPADPELGYGDVVPWRGERVTITADGASGSLRWLVRSPGVKETRLRPKRDGFYGDFFRGRSGPAVLLFGGSEGGLSGEEEAALLASRGFPTLALAYFGEPGIGDDLFRVPLEYFARAARWLSAHTGGGRVAVYGVSRGSEAAQLLGVHYPQLVGKVVALVPGNVVLCSHPGCGGAAWTLHGQAIPFQDGFGPGGPAPIPDERIRAPLFMVCGGGDLIWPSCPMAESIVARRRGLPTTLLRYPDAGHGAGDLLPNVPVWSQYTQGFERSSNPRARRDAWPKLLAFLAG